MALRTPPPFPCSATPGTSSSPCPNRTTPLFVRQIGFFFPNNIKHQFSPSYLPQPHRSLKVENAFFPFHLGDGHDFSRSVIADLQPLFPLFSCIFSPPPWTTPPRGSPPYCTWHGATGWIHPSTFRREVRSRKSSTFRRPLP